MSDLYMSLEKTKLQLLRQKKFHQEALDRCALPGYITSKSIRGSRTYYLQFRDSYNKMTSVHLSKDKLTLCQNSFAEKKRHENELKAIDEDLALLDRIDISLDAFNENSTDSSDTRILDKAVGLSPKHKSLFYLSALEASGDYEIHFFTKKAVHETPMVFVNESSGDRIADYLISASCIVDEALDNMAKEQMANATALLPASGQYRTKTGIMFKFSPSKTGYILSFFYRKKKYDIEYSPYNYDLKGVDQIELARMAFAVEHFIRLNIFATEVKKIYERKQNVYPQTQES